MTRRTPKTTFVPQSISTLDRNQWVAAIFTRPKSRVFNTPEVKVAAESLTRWLNGIEDDWIAHGHASNKNSLESRGRIIELMSAIRGVVHSHGRNRGKRVISFGWITAKLEAYATAPELLLDGQTGRWGVRQRPISAASLTSSITELNSNLRPYGEVMAAHGLLLLTALGGLDRVVQCDCRRWFFAKRTDGVACSNTCRKRLFDQRPENIEKRRARDKENRSNANTGNATEYRQTRKSKFKASVKTSSRKHAKASK